MIDFTNTDVEVTHVPNPRFVNRQATGYWNVRKALLDAVSCGDQDAYTELARAHPAIARSLVNQAKGKRR